ncbi:PAS domain-containing protein [Sneathiella sp. P13V-1]|uniref:PAS domain-containing protein n=1 Tax=Sneathiella sp. P13V-1 TaxID=2697366 RepID=UPI00187BAAA3|nr:PAS domain-containing protein [Sneathiella sp. P13V-1]MBE7638409.1 PAS domain-containing protein [Sneathiella sp. P13V-1]
MLTNWTECEDVPIPDFRDLITPIEQQYLYDYWISKKVNGGLPCRSNLNPADIPRLLSHIGLLDVLDGNDFRYRLIGTSMVGFFGVDYTNTLVSKSKTGKYGRILSELYRTARDEKVPVYSISEFTYDFKDPIQMYRLILPLSSDNLKVDMLLFSTIPEVPGHLSNNTFKVIDASNDFIECSRILDTSSKQADFA